MRRDNWLKVISREYSVQYSEIHHKSLNIFYSPRLMPSLPKWVVSVPENGNETVYFKEREFRKFNNAIVRKFAKNKKQLAVFTELFYRYADDYLQTAKRIFELDLNKKGNSNLKELYINYFQRAVDYTSFLWVGYLLNENWSKIAAELTKGVSEEIRNALISPVKKSSILILQEKASKISWKNRKKISALLKEFSWVSCLDVHKKPWSIGEITEYIKNIKKGEKRKTISFKRALMKSVLQKHKEKFEIIRNLAYLKDVRDDYRRKSVFYAQKLYFEIARRMNIHDTDIAFLTREEIIGFLEGKHIVLGSVEKRRKGFLLYLDERSLICTTENVVNELKKIGWHITSEQIGKIVGTIANKGYAKGIVKIVKTIHDTKNVRKGSIMVAVTTHPDYVFAMQKSAAIVTDEGGITSHAAIVARELKIPCIVGTKNATKSLKDGDFVEVDANKGIVRKIK